MARRERDKLDWGFWSWIALGFVACAGLAYVITLLHPTS